MMLLLGQALFVAGIALVLIGAVLMIAGLRRTPVRLPKKTTEKVVEREVVTLVVCSHCGQKNPQGQARCGQCGAKL